MTDEIDCAAMSQGAVRRHDALAGVRVVVVDNFDSFTYNLVQCLGALGAVVVVHRNDAVTAADVLRESPDRIVVSPGPGGPSEAGVSKSVIRAAAGRVPVLGVCLGHQCLAEVYGARVVRGEPIHGKTSTIRHDGTGVFGGLRGGLVVARYHSLVVEPASLPSELRVTARTDDGVIMGLCHERQGLHGIQFHPESFMTPDGEQIVANFLFGGPR
jgi:anthranilate synthase/aminodeoxychorismate synthase-like glutamine amidotransferase